MNDRNLIFVSYYPGAGGRMISELCNLILIPNFIPAEISEAGEIMTSNELEMVLSSTGSVLDVKIRYNKDEYKLFITLMNKWLTGNVSNIVSSHILNIRVLDQTFPKSKFIIITPQTNSEFEIVKNLWVIKNQQNKWHKKFKPDIDFQQIASNWNFSSNQYGPLKIFIDHNRFLHLSITDIFDDTKIEKNIGIINNFISPKIKLQNKKASDVKAQNLMAALNYYKKYLEINKINF